MNAARPVRVLCIAGSPRRRGNSDRLLDACTRGIEEAGGIAIRLVATDAAPQPCRGCNACSATGECVTRDSMEEVYALIDSADAIVVGSPVFFAGVPATLKALYDRCQPYWARRYVLKQAAPSRKRPGALLVVGAGGDPFGPECAITTTRSVFAVLSVRMSHLLEVIGPDSPTDVSRRSADLDRAVEIGRQMVAEATGRDIVD